MKTIEVKTAELEGAALDWATFCALYKGMEPTIHVAEPVTIERKPFIKPLTFPRMVTLSYSGAYGAECAWMPSGDWSQGGPLIENNRLYVAPDAGGYWWALTPCRGGHEFGPAPLIAACRAIVAAKLGDTVHVPADLIGAAA